MLLCWVTDVIYEPVAIAVRCYIKVYVAIYNVAI